MRALNSSRDAHALRSTTCVGSPARRPRSTPPASAFDDTTQAMWACRRPSAMRSMRFCSVVPPPDSSTPRRIGSGMAQAPFAGWSAKSRRGGIIM
jgi:hypothetical protein